MHLEIFSKHIATYTVAWIPMPHGSDTSLCLGFFNLHTLANGWTAHQSRKHSRGTTEQHASACKSQDTKHVHDIEDFFFQCLTQLSVYIGQSNWSLNLNLKHFIVHIDASGIYLQYLCDISPSQSVSRFEDLPLVQRCDVGRSVCIYMYRRISIYIYICVCT